jgi:hypothetical protein
MFEVSFFPTSALASSASSDSPAPVPPEVVVSALPLPDAALFSEDPSPPLGDSPPLQAAPMSARTPTRMTAAILARLGLTAGSRAGLVGGKVLAFL